MMFKSKICVMGLLNRKSKFILDIEVHKLPMIDDKKWIIDVVVKKDNKQFILLVLRYDNLKGSDSGYSTKYINELYKLDEVEFNECMIQYNILLDRLRRMTYDNIEIYRKAVKRENN